MGYMTAKDYEESIGALKAATDKVLTKMELSPDTKDMDGIGADDMKNKFGNKQRMMEMIMFLTEVCISSGSAMRKMYRDSFDLRGRVADLSTGHLKDVFAKVKDISGTVTSSHSVLYQEIADMKTSIVKSRDLSSIRDGIEEMKESVTDLTAKTAAISTPKKISFAEVLGETKSLMQPIMKKAMEQINEESQKASTLIMIGLDAPDSMTQKDKVIENARRVLEEIVVQSDCGGCNLGQSDFQFLGKLGGAKAPLVKIKFEDEKYAKNLVRFAHKLRKSEKYSDVYLRMDMSQAERERRKELLKVLREKIEAFPDQHWVIRDDQVTSTGKRR